MNPDVIIKKHIYALLGAIAIFFMFADGMTIEENIKKIKSLKRRLDTVQQEKDAYDMMVSQKAGVEAEVEELSHPYARLFEKFPNDETTENQINSTLSFLTAKMIVVRESRKPKNMIEWISEGVEEFTVPKIKDDDPDLKVENQIVVAIYETELELKCNYFELLEFLHAISNQERYFAPVELAITPDPDIPYGVNAKVKIRTFGFENVNSLSNRR
jgi:hypothetical protein